MEKGHGLHHVAFVAPMRHPVLLNADVVVLPGVVPQDVQVDLILADLADGLASLGHVVAIQTSFFRLKFFKFQIFNQFFYEF